MADFQYITKDDSSPQGKPRVCFTAHPDDYQIYFEEIRQDIFKRQNCVIFYLDGNTQPDKVDDYELRLGEMQLFVVPVTTKLLMTPNRAMDVEIPFAASRHIPVLPLIQESGLNELFQQRFGSLQYLNKYDTDPTVIPYHEKLTKFLESVIIGDELVQKIRAAFDAYVFLSYRKKDRKYAQELMRLIHLNPMCRDIAIWYDEFLTPGEDFNDAIEEAMKKSKLFALAVTPNLVNEVNYVLTTEYPKAREMDKEILPVEMVATDITQLKAKYADIPDPIHVSQKQLLDDRMLAMLKDIALSHDDRDAQHTFFIGLAYLKGIDVEIDRDKASKLIISAAKNGYPAGPQTLVAMYSQGEGVRHDFTEAAFWSEKNAEILNEEYQKSPICSGAVSYITALSELAQLHTKAEQYDFAEKVCHQIISSCRTFAEQYPDEYAFMQAQTKAFFLLGDNAYMDDDQEEGLDDYQKGIEVQESSAKRFRTESAKVELAFAYRKTAERAIMLSDDSTAQMCIQRAIAVSKSLKSASMRKELSEAYHTYVFYLIRKKELDTALQYSKKALRLNESVFSDLSDVENKRVLSLSYISFADVWYAKGEASYGKKAIKLTEKAVKYYRKADKLLSEVLDTGKTLAARRDMSKCMIKLGWANKSLGNDDSFVINFYPAIEQQQLIYNETHTTEDCNALIDTYIRFSMEDIQEYQLEGTTALLRHAAKILTQALELVKELLGMKNTVNTRSVSYEIYERLAKVAEYQCDDALRDDYLRQSAELAKSGTHKRDRNVYLDLCERLENKGNQ